VRLEKCEAKNKEMSFYEVLKDLTGNHVRASVLWKLLDKKRAQGDYKEIGRASC